MRLAMCDSGWGYVMRKIEGGGRCFGTRCEACVEYFPRLTGWLGVKVVVSTLLVSLVNVQPIATAPHRDCDVAALVFVPTLV